MLSSPSVLQTIVDALPHENDRKSKAAELGLTLEQFDALLISANHAHQTIKDLGPFYGNEEVVEPTFRISAEPVTLPPGSKERFAAFGEDLLHAGRALQKLPKEVIAQLGNTVDLRLPLTWRIDSILGEDGKIVINEIEGIDGASGLMVGEQLAYGLQTLDESSALYIMKALRANCELQEDHVCTVALIWHNEIKTVLPSYKRLAKFIAELSDGKVQIEPINEIELREGIKLLDQKYHGVLNDSFLTTAELEKMGVGESKIYSDGYYNAICNKGLFGLIFDPELKTFWLEEIGEDRLARLQDILIPTHFVDTPEQMEQMRDLGKVVKLSSTGGSTGSLDNSQGVAVPDGDTKHNSDDRWEALKQVIQQEGVRVITQDYIRPARIEAFLRKKGVNLEKVNWYNRICVKFVCESDPNNGDIKVNITAVEVTLGPNVVPAGRANCFTAGKFAE